MMLKSLDYTDDGDGFERMMMALEVTLDLLIC